MKSKKDQFSKTFAFILLLLAFIASVVIGVNGVKIRVHNYIESKKPKPIVLHNFYEDGKLWFYSPGTTNIQGTYQCNGKGIYCGFAFELIDDKSYSLQYYDSKTQINYTSYIAGNYAFIIDAENPPEEGDTCYRNENVKLINITTGAVLKEYSAIKSYSNANGIDGTFIVRSLDGKWGTIKVGFNGPEDKVPLEYDFVGMFTYAATESPTVTDKFVVKKGSTWSVIDENGTAIISNVPDPIYGYEGTTAATRNTSGEYNIYDSKGTKINLITYYTSVKFSGTGYVLGQRENIQYGIYDNAGKEVKTDQLFFQEDISTTTTETSTTFAKKGVTVFTGDNLSNKGLPIVTQ